jgi:hypothetical protein
LFTSVSSHSKFEVYGCLVTLSHRIDSQTIRKPEAARKMTAQPAALPSCPSAAALPLPRVPGPKLRPFTPTAHTAIEFIEELGSPGANQDSLVWKDKINGAEPFYALKMVSNQHCDDRLGSDWPN